MQLLIFKKRHLYVAAIVVLAIIISLVYFLIMKNDQPVHTYPVFHQALTTDTMYIAG